MKITCMLCGKVVSTEVPDEIIIRAFIECPECIEKQEEEERGKRAECPHKIDEIKKAYTNEGLCPLCLLSMLRDINNQLKKMKKPK